MSLLINRCKIEEGTVIHGTLRSEDLLSKFSHVLNLMCPGHPLVGEYLDLHSSAMREEDYFTPEAYDLCFSIVDAINSYLPEEWYFGPHPGDGSDFGFWKVEIEDPEIVDDFKAMVYADGSNWNL